MPNDTYLFSCRENIVPHNEEERAAIRLAISDRQHLVDQDPEAADAGGLRSELTLLSSLFAPIRRLPLEILSAIVMQPDLHPSVSRGPESATAHFGGRGTSPILAVSYHWRATFLSTPDFWALFGITLPGDARIAHLLEMYLERSQGLPLSIEIRARRPGTIHPGILQQLIESSDRWESLHLNLEPSHLSALSPIRGRLPILLSLEFYVGRGENHPLPGIAQPDYFEIAPQLTRLQISLPTAAIPLLPLSQLKTLLIFSWFNLPFATQCRNLHTLSIPGDVGDVWYKEVPDELRRVGVGAMVLSTFPLMFEFITAPSVQVIEIVAGKAMQTPGAWAAFVERSACHPHTLQMEDVVVTSSELIALLGLLPGLHTLDLHNLRPGAITNQLLARLSEDTGGAILPKLQNLSITGSYVFKYAALLDMLESRLESLERVDLRLTQRFFTAEGLVRARTVKEKGMDLVLWCLNVEKKFGRVV
ncbi:hypothetical protein FB45DRAFT_1121884 [Roridomyces roridus]|uniref:F-box domain-containing protein n=1 Tax=Roridomyces roridus TaxID=1738132 RepID=A0AAD7B4Q1_9AGAR|nr:hypothetical protein FB45DRAFT_1121884 [Roridomyces roridus]